jgi:hypothetical protein
MQSGDGKLVKIRVNGVDVRWIWSAFADQETTLLVGSSMTETESAASCGSSRSEIHCVRIAIPRVLTAESFDPLLTIHAFL